MEHQKRRLTPEDCIALALECEGDAQTEQDPQHRARLLRMASVLRDLAADFSQLPGRRN
jgi:hypothetical protein